MNRKNNRKIITHMIPEYIKNMQNHLEKMYPACFLCDNNCSTGSAIIQLVIPSFLRKQLLMGTTFDNMSLFQNHDTVTVADSGKTVGDNKSRSAFHQLIHAILNQLLGTGINGTGSFNQDQNGRWIEADAVPGSGLRRFLAEACYNPEEVCG